MPHAETKASTAFARRWSGKCHRPSRRRRIGVCLVLAAIVPLFFAEGHGEFGPGQAFAISLPLAIAGVCFVLAGLSTKH